MGYADDMDSCFDDDGSTPPLGSIVVRLSPAMRAGLRLELARIFETSTDSATVTAARRMIDAMELQ